MTTRQDFEQIIVDDWRPGLSLCETDSGEYKDPEVSLAWRVYQAATSNQEAKIKALESDCAIAIQMLADWCVAVEQNGGGWDCWDEHYKDAAYRPTPLREKLDAAITLAKETT